MVLGVFLVGIIAATAIAFVETKASDASRSHNHSAATVENIQFAPSVDTMQAKTWDP